jgi:hypothetical protein
VHDIALSYASPAQAKLLEVGRSGALLLKEWCMTKAARPSIPPAIDQGRQVHLPHLTRQKNIRLKKRVFRSFLVRNEEIP